MLQVISALSIMVSLRKEVRFVPCTHPTFTDIKIVNVRMLLPFDTKLIIIGAPFSAVITNKPFTQFYLNKFWWCFLGRLTQGEKRKNSELNTDISIIYYFCTSKSCKG
jgi:hypothetical protein